VPGTNNEWLLTDTYPFGTPARQELCLYHIPSRRKVLVAELPAPPHRGDCHWGCDLHPRLNRRATQVVIDSEHTAAGRQMYLFDIAKLIGK
jgi:hypothetical protein